MFLPAPPLANNGAFVNSKRFFAIDTPPSSALREIRQHLGATRVLLILGGVALVLGLSGPFDTYSAMRPGPRMIYWALVVFLTYATGYSVSVSLSRLLKRFVQNRWLRSVASGVGAGLCVSLVLGAFNYLALENLDLSSFWLNNLLPAIVIAVIITVVLETFQTPEPETPTTQRPTLLDRLPLDKRGPLVSLSVNDHYVDVVTTKGREMLLMRLSDAIREVSQTPGLQVHRSHWVALDQVVQARRTGETALLTTSAGDDIPASRTHMPALRESGLLPISGAAKGVGNG